MLLEVTGDGLKSTKAMAAGLKPIRTDVKIRHNPYVQRYPKTKVEDTEVHYINGGKTAVIHVGDSKEGWVKALNEFFALLTNNDAIDEISIYYDYIRPHGTRLNTFGGTASGHEPLKEMFEGIEKVLKNEIDPSLEPLEKVGDNRVKVRPIHVLDIANLIGNNVVVGGVRRTAEIFLFDADDYESMFAKYGINGIWNVEQHEKVIGLAEEMGLNDVANMLAAIETNNPDARPLHHRRMSNNSVAFHEKPSREQLNLIFEVMQAEGEPGLINMEE